jgi:hypothetical protein
MKRRARAAAAQGATPAITATLQDLLTAERALQRLSERPLPIKVSYHLGKLRRLVRAETQVFYEERDKLARELGSGDAAGATFTVPPAQLPTFHARLAELTALTVTIAWAPLDLATLGAIEITAADLDALTPLVTGEPA